MIFPEESLHSFIIRTLLRHGLLNNDRDLTGIMKYSGRWLSMPTLQPHQRVAFTGYPVQSLLHSLAENTPLAFSKQFSDPRIIPQLYRQLFLGDTIADMAFIDPKLFDSESLKIRFCPLCFCEQLQRDGVTWFKLHWMRKNAYCKTHDLNLVSISTKTCGCHLNLLNRLLTIMSGQCRRCQYPSWLLQEKRTPSPWPWLGSTSTHSGPNDSISIAPCVTWTIYNEISELQYGPCSALWLRLPHHVQMAFLYIGTLHRHPPNLPTGHLNRLLNAMERDCPLLLASLLSFLAEVVLVSINITGQNNVLVPYQVLKHRDCKTCQVDPKRCPFHQQVKE